MSNYALWLLACIVVAVIIIGAMAALSLGVM